MRVFNKITINALMHIKVIKCFIKKPLCLFVNACMELMGHHEDVVHHVSECV